MFNPVYRRTAFLLNCLCDKIDEEVLPGISRGHANTFYRDVAMLFLFQLLHRMLDSRQLGLKLIANVTYGYTSANFSGRMPCIEVRPMKYYLIRVYHQLYFPPKIFSLVTIKTAVCGQYKSANLPLLNKSQHLTSKYPYEVDWSCLVIVLLFMNFTLLLSVCGWWWMKTSNFWCQIRILWNI